MPRAFPCFLTRLSLFTEVSCFLMCLIPHDSCFECFFDDGVVVCVRHDVYVNSSIGISAGGSVCCFTTYDSHMTGNSAERYRHALSASRKTFTLQYCNKRILRSERWRCFESAKWVYKGTFWSRIYSSAITSLYLSAVKILEALWILLTLATDGPRNENLITSADFVPFVKKLVYAL